MKETYSHEFNWWQRILQKCLGMWRINNDSIDFKWGYFAPKFGFEFIVHRGGYYDQRYALLFCLIWGVFHIKMPFKTRIPESCDAPRYGIQIYANTVWIHLGRTTNLSGMCDSKCVYWDIPFLTWEFNKHFIWFKNKWIEKPRESLLNSTNIEKEIFETNFTYRLNNGNVQSEIATIYLEKRTYCRKWFPFLKKEYISLNISFSGEIGERSGTWKGGVVGCSYDLKNFDPKGDVAKQVFDALAKMEKERKFR